MSIEHKRLQLPTKFSDVVVGLANTGWQTVPEPWSSDCEAPIAEPCVGPWNAARVDVGRSEPATAGVRDKLAVVYKICCSCITQRLVDQEGKLELDSLSDSDRRKVGLLVTARCTLVQSAVLRSHVVCLSVCDVGEL